MTQDNSEQYRSGAALLAAFGADTRERKLEQAVKSLMSQLEELHVDCHHQSLGENIDNEEIFCGCADAYRMGHEALKP
jgi:hypothetical protein